MANYFNKATNTWVIDTASNDPVKGAGANETGLTPIKVKLIRWVGGANTGDQVVVTNGDDITQQIWAAKADGPNYTDEILIEDWWDKGFAVPTLDSGTVFVDLR